MTVLEKLEGRSEDLGKEAQATNQRPGGGEDGRWRKAKWAGNRGIFQGRQSNSR